MPDGIIGGKRSRLISALCKNEDVGLLEKQERGQNAIDTGKYKDTVRVAGSSGEGDTIAQHTETRSYLQSVCI